MQTLIPLSDDELKPGEPHPSARSALKWVAAELARYPEHIEAIASVAMSGNRNAAVLLGTINRLATNQGVSDRYLLGLAWFLRDAHDSEIRGKEDVGRYNL